MNIFKIIKNHADSHGDSVALKYDNIIITYSELINMIIFGQNVMKNKRIKKNQCLIIKENDKLSYILNLICALSCGIWVIPVLKNITQCDLDEILKDTDSRVLDDDIDFLNCGYQTSILDYPNEKEVGFYHMTSGSTGKPKYCIRTLEAVTQEGSNYVKAYDITRIDRTLCTCPLSHSFANGGSLFASLIAGAAIYLVNHFNPRKIIKELKSNKITYLLMVASSAKLLCLANENLQVSGFSLRVALVGASPLNKKLYDDFYEKFRCYLLINYGSTETGAVMSRVNHLPYNSVGKPMNGVSVKLVKQEEKGDTELEEGQLYIKSKCMMSGYLNNSNIFDEDGYIPMGDLVYTDLEGNYYIKKRIKTLIKIGGNSINPIKVEKIIKQFPGVENCFVYESKGKDINSVLMATIIGSKIDVDLLKKFCKNYLLSYMIPTVIKIKQNIEYNEMGKVKL